MTRTEAQTKARRERKEAEKQAELAEADSYANRPFTHRVIPASEAQPIETKGVNSVWQLAQ